MSIVCTFVHGVRVIFDTRRLPLHPGLRATLLGEPPTTNKPVAKPAPKMQIIAHKEPCGNREMSPPHRKMGSSGSRRLIRGY